MLTSYWEINNRGAKPMTPGFFYCLDFFFLIFRQHNQNICIVAHHAFTTHIINCEINCQVGDNCVTLNQSKIHNPIFIIHRTGNVIYCGHLKLNKSLILYIFGTPQIFPFWSQSRHNVLSRFQVIVRDVQVFLNVGNTC